MGNWSKEAWENEFPGRNEQVMRALEQVWGHLGPRIHNAGEIIEVYSIGDDPPARSPWWASKGLECKLYQDKVQIVIALMVNASTLLVAGAGISRMLSLAAFFRLLKEGVVEAVELRSDPQSSVFCWELHVPYEKVVLVGTAVQQLLDQIPPMEGL